VTSTDQRLADLGALSREELLALAREYMLFGHLIDRGLMPHVAMRFGSDEVTRVAIEEWMGASPVYTWRMRDLMQIDGDDVEAIMKSLQLDVGFVHEYMDVHYEVTDPLNGAFWLEHCGALMDTEPMGEKYVVAMCHDIEDPTFDATANAVNPKARIRPIHRPPRVPAGRLPMCHWTLVIDPTNDPVGRAAITDRVAALPLAAVPVTRPAADGSGRSDYAGAFDPDFRLDALATPALVAVMREFSMQSHLIVSAANLAIADRHGTDVARETLLAQWLGVGPLATERIVAALDIAGGGVDPVDYLLRLHPMLPGGLDVTTSVNGARVDVTIGDPHGLLDPANPGWLGLLGAGEVAAFEATVQVVDPTARVSSVDVQDGGLTLTLDVGTAEPAILPREVDLVRLSTASSWQFAHAR
jgi:hypothetical protein